MVALGRACGAVQGRRGPATWGGGQPPCHVCAVPAIGLPRALRCHSHGTGCPLLPNTPVFPGTHRGQGGLGGQWWVAAVCAAQAEAPPHLLAQHHAGQEDEGALGREGAGGTRKGVYSLGGSQQHPRQVKGSPSRLGASHWHLKENECPPIPTRCSPLIFQTA